MHEIGSRNKCTRWDRLAPRSQASSDAPRQGGFICPPSRGFLLCCHGVLLLPSPLSRRAAASFSAVTACCSFLLRCHGVLQLRSLLSRRAAASFSAVTACCSFLLCCHGVLQLPSLLSPGFICSSSFVKSRQQSHSSNPDSKLISQILTASSFVCNIAVPFAYHQASSALFSAHASALAYSWSEGSAVAS